MYRMKQKQTTILGIQVKWTDCNET